MGVTRAHVMHPYRRASMASAFSNRALSLNGAFGPSKSSVENFLKHPQAMMVRRLISGVMSAINYTGIPAACQVAAVTVAVAAY